MADGPHILFGRKITTQRRHLRLNQSQAARLMDVARTALNRWENGHELPSGESMIKLRDHLHLPIGTDEKVEGPTGLMEAACQLALPFDRATNFELKVTRKSQDIVQLEIRVKGLTG
jgi:transcriptional regulator with XRE-family HTH domain